MGQGRGKPRRAADQKLHVGSMWLASYMPDGKPTRGDAPVRLTVDSEAPLQAEALEWES